jgi:hypothetical protein
MSSPDLIIANAVRELEDVTKGSLFAKQDDTTRTEAPLDSSGLTDELEVGKPLTQ